MEPLSVIASVVGLLTTAGKVSEVLTSITSNLKEAPRIAHCALSEINGFHSVLESLYKFLLKVSAAPKHRTALIQLDQIIIALTDAVLSFSDLEALITPLMVPVGSESSLQTRIKLVWKDCRISFLIERLQHHKASLSLMLHIVQCESEFEAAQSQESLQNHIRQLVESNQELSGRLKAIEDALDAKSLIGHSGNATDLGREIGVVEKTKETGFGPRTRVSSISRTSSFRFTFEKDLESSHVYKRTQFNTCDASFTSSVIRTNAWSVFSGRSLADISDVSVVALPIYSNSISNKQSYSFGNSGHGNPQSTIETTPCNYPENPTGASAESPKIPVSPTPDAAFENLGFTKLHFDNGTPQGLFAHIGRLKMLVKSSLAAASNGHSQRTDYYRRAEDYRPQLVKPAQNWNENYNSGMYDIDDFLRSLVGILGLQGDKAEIYGAIRILERLLLQNEFSTIPVGDDERLKSLSQTYHQLTELMLVQYNSKQDLETLDIATKCAKRSFDCYLEMRKNGGNIDLLPTAKLLYCRGLQREWEQKSTALSTDHISSNKTTIDLVW